MILTGLGDLDAAQRAIRLDVVDFLSKPASLGDLELALNRAWRRRNQLLERDPLHADATAAFAFDAESDSARNLRDVEREHILSALDRNHGNRGAAAAELGISIRTLYYRLAEYERQGWKARE
jgi:DNA-binding NtrC family response regulator